MAIYTLDFETAYSSKKDATGSDYSLSRLSYEDYLTDPRFKVFGVGIKETGNKTDWYGPSSYLSALKELFPAGNTNTLVAHNAMFDALIMNWQNGLKAGNYICTQMMSRALWRYESASLKNLATRLWPDDPAMRKGEELVTVDGVYEPTPAQLDILGRYCIQDVDLTWAALLKMYNALPKAEMDIIDMTIRMFVEPQLVLDKELTQSVIDNVNEKRDALVKAAGVSETILRSNKQFTEYLKEHHNVIVPVVPSPTEKNPNNTKLALSKDDLEFIALRRDNPELEHIWKARIAVSSTGEKTRAERFLRHAHPKSGKIGVYLNYCGAGTTRWSGGNKTNFQNLGRKSPLRPALRAPEGYKVVTVDLSAIEGRVNAWQAGAQWKLDAYARGEDLYNALAESIFKQPVDRKSEDDPEQKRMGTVGKVGELGLGYQMGPTKFKDTLAKGAMAAPVYLTDSEAQKAVRGFREKNAEIAQSWIDAEAIIYKMGTLRKGETYKTKGCIVKPMEIVMPSGLSLQYPELTYEEDPQYGSLKWEYWNGKFFKSLYGGLLIENIVQGLARCILAEQMIDINQWLKKRAGFLVHCVHDEVVCVVPKEVADECLAYIIKRMSQSPSWAPDLPLGAEGTIKDHYDK